MLEVSVPIAHELLTQCVRQGQALVQRASLVGDFSDYESWKAARNQWIDPTAQVLEHMYGGTSHAGEFTQLVTAPSDGQRWQQQYAADLDAVKAAIDLLTVLQSELAFTREDAVASQPAPELMAGGPDDGGDGGAEPDRVPGDGEPTYTSEAARELPHSYEAAPEPALVEQQAEHRTPDLQPQELRATQTPAQRDAHQLPDEDERLDDRPSLGGELAPAPFVGAELAQHANGSLSAERAGSPGPAPAHTKQVLLAHGRNERWMQAVARLLEQAGTHEVTILNERPSVHGALAEHFGEHTPGARYAVVLLTADDIAAPRVESEDEPYFSPRAHQAVVFEMGFLVAALAPGRVCVLYEEGVQLPCDLQGIAYVRLDPAGTWQPKLLLQLRKAGFDYDLNKLVAA